MTHHTYDISSLTETSREFLRLFSAGANLSGVDITEAIFTIDCKRGLRDTTLYQAIRRLYEGGFIEPSKSYSLPSTRNAGLRKHYAITSKGKAMLKAIKKREETFEGFFAHKEVENGTISPTNH